MTSHVEVALPLPLHRTFTYRLEGPVPPPGTRVLVPFQQSEKVGWIAGEGDPEGISGIRPVRDVLERVPSVPPELFALARWVADYYVAPLGITLRSFLPSVLSDGAREVVRLTPAGRHRLEVSEKEGGLPASARELLEAVGRRGGEARVGALRHALAKRAVWPALRRLTGEGLLEHETLPPPDPPIRTRKVMRLKHWIPDLAERDERFGRAGRQRACYELLEASGGACELGVVLDDEGFSRSVVSALEDKGLVAVEEVEVMRDPFHDGDIPPVPTHDPTPAQSAAVTEIVGAADTRRPAPFLLHGVTGSGKTLVYGRILEEIVGRRGKSAIVLVPEIALTPQAVARFRGWFGSEVAVLHSALSAGERFDQWRQIRAGAKRVVVGARSALFAPVPNLGAIVVDEEHDTSYKQSEAPRYQARDVAVVRARLAGALCILGSATPSLESWRNAETGKFRLLSLPDRIGGRRLPPVEIVDLRRVRPAAAGSDGGEGILSPRLVAAVRERLAREEQTILLLNRRGFASFVQCRACGEVQECPNCSVSLTYHRARKRLLCHHCRHEEAPPERCRSCGSQEVSLQGAGTERVERAVAMTFPAARIARMDVDTTSGRWSHHEILGRVERHEVDILLGTQMIAKGLDFPRVTLVGVVNADVGIHLPDFRASERSFQLLSQVAGRAGRGDLGGQVVIQTSLPEHYVIQTALAHDVVGFVRRELEERRSPPYPPHVRLVNVVVSSPDRALAADAAERVVGWLRERMKGPEGRGLELVGPAPSPIERLHGRWRWHFFLRGRLAGGVTTLLRAVQDEFALPAGDVRLVVDRDPVALL